MRPPTLSVIGTGLSSPGAAVTEPGPPGVTVIVQVAPGASDVQVDAKLVPPKAGLPARTAQITDSAVSVPMFLIVKLRGVPPRAGETPVSFTDSAREDGLIDNVVDGVTPVGAPAPPPLPPQAANSTAEHKDIQRAEER